MFGTTAPAFTANNMKQALKKIFSFVNLIIIYCLGAMTIITAITMYDYHRLDVVIPPELYSQFVLFFGGELLMLVVRQVLGSDVTHGKSHNDME